LPAGQSFIACRNENFLGYTRTSFCNVGFPYGLDDDEPDTLELYKNNMLVESTALGVSTVASSGNSGKCWKPDISDFDDCTELP